MPHAIVAGAGPLLSSALGLPEPALTDKLPETALTVGLSPAALTAGVPDAGASTSGSGNWLPGSRAVGAAAEKLGREAAGIAPLFVLAYTSDCSMIGFCHLS